jgi:Protein of unknown function (DUF2612)
MASSYLDRIELAQSRTANMYAESTRFQQWLSVLVGLQQDSEDCLQQMALQAEIEQATGVNLYTIATIVGAPIVYTSKLLSPFIGFNDQQGGFPFWDEDDPAITGGEWREDGEHEVTLDELWEAQRLVIRCKIVKNHSDGSGDAVQRGLMFLFPNVQCIVYDNRNMSFSIGIGRELSPIEKELILLYDILPRPVGVQLDQVVAYDQPFFGFADQTGASGFDIGHWANLQYLDQPERVLDISLIPTTR